MAWSDAARKAALEARRLHARAKPGGTPKLGIGTPSVRKQLAMKIRDLRSGRVSANRPVVRRLMVAAKTSTLARNAMRKVAPRPVKKPEWVGGPFREGPPRQPRGPGYYSNSIITRRNGGVVPLFLNSIGGDSSNYR